GKTQSKHFNRTPAKQTCAIALHQRTKCLARVRRVAHETLYLCLPRLPDCGAWWNGLPCDGREMPSAPDRLVQTAFQQERSLPLGNRRHRHTSTQRSRDTRAFHPLGNEECRGATKYRMPRQFGELVGARQTFASSEMARSTASRASLGDFPLI